MSIHSYKTKQGKIIYQSRIRSGGRGSPWVSKSGFKTKTEAKHWEDEQKVNMRNGYRAVIKASRLGEYLEQWIETKMNIGISQEIRIRQHLKHIIPDLGYLKIDAISPKHVYDLRNKKKRSEDNPNGELAPRTIRAMEFCLKGALQDTVGNRLGFMHQSMIQGGLYDPF